MNEGEEEKHTLDCSGRNMWSQEFKSFLETNISDSVIYLDLSCNHINFGAAEFLANYLKSPSCNIRSLSVAQCRLDRQSSVAIFSAIGESKLYEFYGDDNIYEEVCFKYLSASLSMNPPLELLSLVGCQICDAGFMLLAKSLKFAKSLHHLRIDSNSIFESGARVLASDIHFTSLYSLSIGDNEIWGGGTSEIIKQMIAYDKLQSLDLSYNIIDLEILGSYVSKSARLVELCISGCKVSEEKINPFMENIGRSRIQKLIMDGFNLTNNPVSWPRVRDVVWSKYSHFQALLESVKQNLFLSDLRIGYLEPDQIELFKYALPHRLGIKKEFYMSLQDFGHIGNTWLIQFPEYKVYSPSPVFRYAGKYPINQISGIVSLFKDATCNGQPLDSIDYSGLKIGDEYWTKTLVLLKNYRLKTIDLTNCELGNSTLDTFVETYNSSDFYVDNLYISGKNRFSQYGIRRIIQQFADRPEQAPKIFTITFGLRTTEDMIVLDYARSIDEMIAKNSYMEVFKINGGINSVNAALMVSSLYKNSHLKTLEIESTVFAEYTSPDPELDPAAQKNFDDFVDHLYKALFDEESVCILEKLYFPLLTEIYLYSESSLSRWIEITQKMEENKIKNQSNVKA